EIALHVVDQQGGAITLQRPLGARGRNFRLGRQGVGRDGGQASRDAHALPSSSRMRWRSAARSSRRLTLPTAVTAKSSTKTIWSGTLKSAMSRLRIHAFSSTPRGGAPLGMMKAQIRSPR